MGIRTLIPGFVLDSSLMASAPFGAFFSCTVTRCAAVTAGNPAVSGNRRILFSAPRLRHRRAGAKLGTAIFLSPNPCCALGGQTKCWNGGTQALRLTAPCSLQRLNCAFADVAGCLGSFFHVAVLANESQLSFIQGVVTQALIFG